MNKTYSLRNTRTPTAAQLQAPPPPPATSKSKFFGTSSIASSFRKGTAGSFGPEMARKLAQMIKTEKGLMKAMELSSYERRAVARQLSFWGFDHEDDVSDVTDKLGVLLFELAELQEQFTDKYDQYRITLKTIRNLEASVQPTRERKEKVTNQIASLKYKDPQSTKIAVLEQELVRAEAESLVAEAQLSNLTREKLKAALNYKFDAIRELSEKFALIAGYGKALLELLDDTPATPGETRPAYDGYEASRQIIVDAESALEAWTFDVAAIKPSLSFHHTADDVYAEVDNRRVREDADEEEEDEVDEDLYNEIEDVDDHNEAYAETGEPVANSGSVRA